MAFRSFSLERLLSKSRRAPVHPVFPSSNNRISVRPGSLLLIERRDDGRERQGAELALEQPGLVREPRCRPRLTRRRGAGDHSVLPPAPRVLNIQLRQVKVVLLAGLEVVKVSNNQRLLPQSGFSSSASSLTLPAPVIVRKWLCRLPNPTAMP